jgi:hypothetical protein
VATFYRAASLLVGLMLIGITVGGASAQSRTERPTGACFDITPAQARPSLTCVILLNRCNGEAWLLVRTHETTQRLQTSGFLYRWRPIAIDRAEEGNQVPPRPVPEIPNASAKCFIFDGRQFCE